jgi:hypothetical protein
LIILTFSLLALAGCGTLDIDSRWREAAIVVDARLDDWQGRLFDIEDINVSFGVENDDRDLFLSLRAADPRVLAQIFRSGLVVWFDPEGGKDRVLGIHYPLARDWRDFEGPAAADEEERKRRREETRERLEDVEILGPGRDEKARFRIGEVPGLDLASRREGGLFVLEARIPLGKAEGSPYAIGARPGGLVGIRIDSARLDFASPGRGMGRPGGGFGPGGVGRGGMGRGGIMIGRGLRGAEPLKLRLKARLAESPR